MNKKGISVIYIIIFVVLLIAFVGYAWYNNYQQQLKNPKVTITQPTNNTKTNSQPTIKVKITSTTYPNAKLTPGVPLTMDAIFFCQAGYNKLYKNLSDDVKKQVFKEYNIAYPPRGLYQVDRLIPFELGGSTDIKNLWPQSDVYPGFNEKDAAEHYLRALVCNRTMNSTEAQYKIKTDWVKVFQTCCAK